MNRHDVIRWIGKMGIRAGVDKIPGAKLTYKYMKKKSLPNGHVYRTFPSTHEPKISKAFSEILQPGDTVIEIGGYHGSHTINISNSVGPSGRVIVFEPHPEHAEIISERIDENNISNVKIEQKAATSSSGKIRLWMDQNDSSTSSTALSHENGEYRTVDSVDIENYIKNIVGDRSKINLCKVDIEGGEYELIMNSDILSYSEYLVIELHSCFIGSNKTNELLSKLRQFGNISDIDGGVISIGDIEKSDTSHIIWENNN